MIFVIKVVNSKVMVSIVKYLSYQSFSVIHYSKVYWSILTVTLGTIKTMTVYTK